jgi:ankyrin repeat protein
MLIDHDPDMMKQVDVDGNTPLHLACTHGYEEVALFLMKNHADIGTRYDRPTHTE